MTSQTLEELKEIKEEDFYPEYQWGIDLLGKDDWAQLCAYKKNIKDITKELFSRLTNKDELNNLYESINKLIGQNVTFNVNIKQDEASTKESDRMVHLSSSKLKLENPLLSSLFKTCIINGFSRFEIYHNYIGNTINYHKDPEKILLVMKVYANFVSHEGREIVIHLGDGIWRPSKKFIFVNFKDKKYYK